MPGWWRRFRPAPVLLLLLLARPAHAADVMVFASLASPSDTWGTGYGAAVTGTVLKVFMLEGEAFRLPGPTDESNLTSFSGSVFLAIPIKAIHIFAGAGIGISRESVASATDTALFTSWGGGLKLKLGDLVVAKAEYRRFKLDGQPPLPLEQRFSAGIGVTF